MSNATLTSVVNKPLTLKSSCCMSCIASPTPSTYHSPVAYFADKTLPTNLIFIPLERNQSPVVLYACLPIISFSTSISVFSIISFILNKPDTLGSFFEI